MSSQNGVSDETLDALVEIPAGGFVADEASDARLTYFEPMLRVALAYADAMTVGDVDDELFHQVSASFTDDEIVELTEAIAWENASARFNRALRIGSQGFWKRKH